MLGGFLARIFRGPDTVAAADEEAAWRLYRAAVDQARTDTFYLDYGVADSIDGRFDLIILHVILLIRRLRREGERGAAIAQGLFDATFADMDRSLREMGVGDLGVGRRVKAMAKAFYGRAQAYDDALEVADRSLLSKALRRNVYGEARTEPEAVEMLADYVLQIDLALVDQTADKLMIGEVIFEAPSARAAA